jgi:predicted amidophosphoribosyltransferase
MKFVYKIYSGYNGFVPGRIPERLIDGKFLVLGWVHYLDVVERGREVWVYFHGPHAFVDGIYATGVVRGVDFGSQRVTLQLQQWSADQPITDVPTGEAVASIVSPRYRQVFILPEEVVPTPDCTLASTADSCLHQYCSSCPFWKSLPRIGSEACGWPPRLGEIVKRFVSAFWVIPSRCFWSSTRLLQGIRQTSEIFYRFKVGERALVFPLALGIYESLATDKMLDFDCIVPIPLSPEKAARQELHRTRALAQMLSEIIGTKVAEVLQLNESISKRVLLAAGWTPSEFERRYISALSMTGLPTGTRRVLLIDDVCTQGSTITSAATKISEANSEVEVFAATGGQMILKAVVLDENSILAEPERSE